MFVESVEKKELEMSLYEKQLPLNANNFFNRKVIYNKT